MSNKVIAQKMGWLQHTIQRLLVAIRDLPENTTSKGKPCSRRPRTITNTGMMDIIQFVIANPTNTAARLKIEHHLDVGHLSEHRLPSVLQKDPKLPNLSAANKPLLTQTKKKRRLAFC